MGTSISGMGHPGSSLSSVSRHVHIPAQATPDTRRIGGGTTGRHGEPDVTDHVDHRLSGVAEAALAPTKVIRTAPPRPPRTPKHRLRGLLALQVLAMLGVGAAGAVLMDATPSTTSAVLLLSLLVRFHGGRTAIRPGSPRPGRMATDMALPFSVS